jgi:ABC-2 type transport system permease protein
VGRLINAEMFKLRKRFMTLLLGLILVGMLIFIYLVLSAISNRTLPANAGAQAQAGLQAMKDALGVPFAIPFALNIFPFLGGILSVIMVASSAGNEYGWKTIRPMLVSSESRNKFLASKLIASLIFVLIGILATVVIGFLMSIITNAIAGNSLSMSFFTGSYAWEQFVQFWRVFYVVLPFVMMSFLFSIVGRSAMPGIAFGVGFLFLEPVLIDPLLRQASGWVSSIPNYLFNANVQVITNLGGTGEGFNMIGRGLSDAAAPTPLHAFITLGIYSAVFLGLSFYLFKKRDVTG